jgi:hypothetical protein
MRALPVTAGLGVILAATAIAVAQPAPTGAAPPTTGATGAAYFPTPIALPPPPAPRRSWFGGVGLGPMGYAGRGYTPYDDGEKGSGLLLEAFFGKWLDSDKAVGARVEAHTDDARNYTDSSLTAIVRFPVGASGRFYLEPSLGLGFHKDENSDETENALAVGIAGGYQLTRRRFACDLRFGGAHLRFDPDELSHGLLWLGISLGFQ